MDIAKTYELPVPVLRHWVDLLVAENDTRESEIRILQAQIDEKRTEIEHVRQFSKMVEIIISVKESKIDDHS